MQVNTVGSQSNSTRQVSNDIVDKNVFLKILTVELSNQDPLNTKDNTEYIAQLAQFSSLEQTQNLNTSMAQLLKSQKFTEGAMLIGHEVEFMDYDSEGNTVFKKEVVNSVKVENGEVYLLTNNNTYSMDQVTGVGDKKVDNQSGEQSQTV